MRNTYELIGFRKKLIEELGGLPSPVVKNEEWLYLFKEETRNSIVIEGHFVSEEEMEAVLSGKEAITRDEKVALNYFKTALFVYGLAYENYKTEEFIFTESLIRQINKGILGEGGEYRRGEIRITGAELTPLCPFHLEEWVRLYVDWVKENAGSGNFTDFLVKEHILFESIHPFSDGNGRTGRVILNYLLISRGYPPVVIKGDEESRKRYIRALEVAEEPPIELFQKELDKKELERAMNEMNARLMRELIEEALIRSMDTILVPLLEKKHNITFILRNPYRGSCSVFLLNTPVCQTRKERVSQIESIRMSEYTTGMLLMGLGVIAVFLFFVWLAHKDKPASKTHST